MFQYKTDKMLSTVVTLSVVTIHCNLYRINILVTSSTFFFRTRLTVTTTTRTVATRRCRGRTSTTTKIGFRKNFCSNIQNQVGLSSLHFDDLLLLKYTKPGWGISAFIIAFLMTYFCSDTQNQAKAFQLLLLHFQWRTFAQIYKTRLA